MIEFARRYDPQPFHLDEEAGRRSVLGGLCASGWFTVGLWMRAYVTTGAVAIDVARLARRPGLRLAGTAVPRRRGHSVGGDPRRAPVTQQAELGARRAAGHDDPRRHDAVPLRLHGDVRDARLTTRSRSEPPPEKPRAERPDFWALAGFAASDEGKFPEISRSKGFVGPTMPRQHERVITACSPARWEMLAGADDPVAVALRPLAALAQTRRAGSAERRSRSEGQALRRHGARFGARSLRRRLALCGTLVALVAVGAPASAQAALPGGDAVAQAAAPVAQAAAPVTQAAAPVVEAAAPVTQAAAPAPTPTPRPAAAAAAGVGPAGGACTRGRACGESVQRAAETAAAPVREAAAPVAETVQRAAEPVAEPVREAAAPVAESVQRAVEPVAAPVRDTAGARGRDRAARRGVDHGAGARGRRGGRDYGRAGRPAAGDRGRRTGCAGFHPAGP